MHEGGLGNGGVGGRRRTPRIPTTGSSSNAANGTHGNALSSSTPACGNGTIADDLAYLASKKTSSSLPTTTRSRRLRKRGGSMQKKRSTWHYMAMLAGLVVVYLTLSSGGRQRAARALRRRRRATTLLRKKNDATSAAAAAAAAAGVSGGNPYDAEDVVRAKREAAAAAELHDADGEEQHYPAWKFWQRRGPKHAIPSGGGVGGGRRKRHADISNVPKEYGVWSPNRKYKWVDVRQLPPLPGGDQEDMIDRTIEEGGLGMRDERSARDFKKKYAGGPPMAWEADADDDGMTRHAATNDAADAEHGTASASHPNHGKGITGGSNPKVDYTSIDYNYPSTMSGPPAEGGYPFLEPLGTLMTRWPQDDIDHPPQPFVEQLQHFDYNDPEQVQMALKFRDAELPFKVYNVPEVVAAGKKWTDEYVAGHFDRDYKTHSLMDGVFGRRQDKRNKDGIPGSKGHCQEAEGNFFSFFIPMNWEPRTLGPPPTMDNDLTYARWAKHARYADKVSLGPTEKHFYWQAGIPREERLHPEDTWTFVSRDLPSFSSPEPTFFGFMPEMQKGIQCRFGERGVTAATHYDAGRNMVAMMVGAKRYVLSPPNACPNLGIVTRRRHPVFRHSLLNFGYLNLLEGDDPDVDTMPKEERAWLEVARDSMAVETVLKAGEVLYIPSHWFHYITSLQKSAQCNTRSGRDKGYHPEHGGFDDVMECVGEGA